MYLYINCVLPLLKEPGDERGRSAYGTGLWVALSDTAPTLSRQSVANTRHGVIA
jgi:hypothetical protein